MSDFDYWWFLKRWKFLEITRFLIINKIGYPHFTLVIITRLNVIALNPASSIIHHWILKTLKAAQQAETSN